jgi:hypothetical protein
MLAIATPDDGNAMSAATVAARRTVVKSRKTQTPL